MAGELVKADQVLRIGQRIEFYVDDDEEKYLSRIEDITDKYLVAAMPYNRKRVPVIPITGANVYALAVGQKCRYRFFSVFRGKTLQDGYLPVWQIDMPDRVEKHQNREFVRVRVTKKVSVSVIGRDGSIGEPTITYTVDLSGNGVCFIMKDPLPQDTEVALELYDIPDVGTVKVMGRVIHSTEFERRDGNVFHVGTHMEHLSRQIMNKIVRYLFYVQRRNIAKGVEF